ncbi:MAG: PorV/PorQ family protein [Balneolia bacterium]|nr:PorV/PorQ family protein [Balneolia bacterium]
MKLTSIRFLLLTALLLVFSQNETHGQTGLDFLNIGPNAHSLSLSEAHTAVPLGSNSVFTNPANLLLSDQSSLGLSYTLWIAETQNTQASAAIRRDNDSFAFGVLSSVIDEFEQRDSPGQSGGTFSVQYLAVSGAYARQIGFISAGVSASYLYEQLFQQNASGYSFSFGATAELMDERLRIGTALTNAGQMSRLDIERTKVPTRWRAGFDVNAIQLSAFSGAEIPLIINLSGDVVVPLEDEIDTTLDNAIESDPFFSFGLQAELYDMIAVRGGYRTGNTVRHWSLGASISVDPIKFHYGFVPFETGFGSVHSISLQYFFDW